MQQQGGLSPPPPTLPASPRHLSVPLPGPSSSPAPNRARAASASARVRAASHSTQHGRDISGVTEIDKDLEPKTCHQDPAGGLRRIFIGPHFVGQGVRQESVLSDEEYASTSGSTSSSSSSDEEDYEGRAERARRRIARGRRRRRATNMTTATAATAATGETGETVHPVGRATGSRKPSLQKWVGGSFEIGGDVRKAVARQERLAARRRGMSESSHASHVSTTNDDGASFMTARTHLGTPRETYKLKEPPVAIENAVSPDTLHQLMRQPSDPVLSGSVSLAPPVATPSKSILRHNAYARNGVTIGNGHPVGASMVEAQSVRSLPPPIIGTSATPTHPFSAVKFSQPRQNLVGDQPPAHPSTVLSRPDEDTPIVSFPPKRRRPRDEVVRKERMLVRCGWTQREDLPDDFDENSARRYPTQQEPWEEFGVVWRPNRIELWTEQPFYSAAFVLGHKKLKHVIPLSQGATNFSLYSSPDAIFCLTSRPSATSASRLRKRREDGSLVDADEVFTSKSTKHAYVHFRHSGTNVFLFRSRTTSAAKEWMWHLYRSLGGSVPPSLEISVPGLGVKIRLPIPADLPVTAGKPGGPKGYLSYEEREGEGYRLLHPSIVVEACEDRLRHVTEWKELFAVKEREGMKLRLAWRRGAVLDWVTTGEDETDWGVVGGLSMRQANIEPCLEIRLAAHYPTTVRKPAGSVSLDASNLLVEPPSVEGFLVRRRPNGSSERVYLSSHNGHLFVCHPSTAHPPEPPLPPSETVNNPAAMVLAPFVLGFASLGKQKTTRQRLWENVVARLGLGEQLPAQKRNFKAAQKVADEHENESLLEKLTREEKKRAYDQIHASRGYLDLNDVVSIAPALDTPEEIEAARLVIDVGGADGLLAAADKVLLTKQRSFVLTKRNGLLVTFECHSIAVREEWVTRLTALVAYWARRERVDAIEQMEMHPSSTFGSRRARPLRPGEDPPAPVSHDQTHSAQLLSKIYNFCVVEECRPIIRCDRFYVKRGLRGKFKERNMLLLSGMLLEFKTHQRDMHGQSLQSAYHRRTSAAISLRGMYVYSGQLTASFLSPHSGTTWDPADAQELFPRIYTGTDGLRVADEEANCTLVIFKAANRGGGRFGQRGTTYVLRARSTVERDEWVFALNTAIESFAKVEKAREDRVKEFPWLKASSAGNA